jgi:hemoglobin
MFRASLYCIACQYLNSQRSSTNPVTVVTGRDQVPFVKQDLTPAVHSSSSTYSKHRLSMMAAAANKQHILDRIGGEDALALAVDKFYEKNIAHEEVARFFEGVNMKLLRAHQFKFMKLAFTEIPEGMNVGAIIEKSHGRLFDMGLNEKHFDVIASNLVETMQELGVASNVIDDAVAVVAPLRGIFEEQANQRV